MPVGKKGPTTRPVVHRRSRGGGAGKWKSVDADLLVPTRLSESQVFLAGDAARQGLGWWLTVDRGWEGNGNGRQWTTQEGGERLLSSEGVNAKTHSRWRDCRLPLVTGDRGWEQEVVVWRKKYS